MTEFETTAEQNAELALNEYLYADPSIQIGFFEAEQLQEWRRNCEGVQLTPEQRYFVGWLNVEIACSLRANTAIHEPNLEALEALSRAIQDFQEVARNPNPHIHPLLRAQAQLAEGGASVLHHLCGGISRDAAFSTYLRLQGAAAKGTVNHLMETGSAKAAMLADTLSIIMLLSASGDEGFIPLPPTPRNVAANVDGFYRSNALVLDTHNNLGIWRVRVAEDGPADILVVPPQALLQHAYPSRSGSGTLEVIITQQDILDRAESLHNASAAEKTRLIKLIEKTNAHTGRVSEAVVALLREQLPLAAAHREVAAEPVPPRTWYRGLHAQRLPYLVNAELLDEAIAEHETLLLEEDITISAARELGHMYLESGMGRAMHPRATRAQVIGDFDRAEDILHAALELQEGVNAVDKLLLRLDAAALPLYRALATRDEAIADFFDTYIQSLVSIGRIAIVEYAALPDKTSADAQRLDQLIQQLTCCLFINYNGGGSYLALPPTARQASGRGWQVSVWAETLNGFEIANMGRVRTGETADRLALSEGIVTITSSEIGQKRPYRTATLELLCSQIEGTPEPQKQAGKRVKQLAKAWQSLDKAVNAAHE